MTQENITQLLQEARKIVSIDEVFNGVCEHFTQEELKAIDIRILTYQAFFEGIRFALENITEEGENE
jgi:hypothetical protein